MKPTPKPTLTHEEQRLVDETLRQMRLLTLDLLDGIAARRRAEKGQEDGNPQPAPRRHHLG